MKVHRFIKTLAVAGACGVTGSAAWAETNLIETTWVAESRDCAIREITFYDFGRALVTADHLGTDDADWHEDRAMVHVVFHSWNGALDGVIEDETEFKATYTWRSDETLAANSVACPFRRK